MFGNIITLEENNPQTLEESGIKKYPGSFFNKNFPNFSRVVADPTAGLGMIELIVPDNSAEIISALEEKKLIPWIRESHLVWFCLTQKGRTGWFVAHVAIKSEKDEEGAFFDETSGEWLRLVTVSFYWDDDGWRLHACPASDPVRWYAGRWVLFRKSFKSQD